VPDYGSTGTVLSSLTTRKADYQRVSATHENPRASECLSEIEPDGGDDRSSDDGDTSGDATFTIGPLETNTPIDSGESLEVSVTVENTGGPPARRNSSSSSVPARNWSNGGRCHRCRRADGPLDGYETPVIANDHEFPIRIESDDDTSERSVLVYGRGDRAEAEERRHPIATRSLAVRTDKNCWAEALVVSPIQNHRTSGSSVAARRM